ncbi:MAG: phage tail protein [Catenulispora sp.]|nr:phage tail protein [Catenulispora sp.]
MTDKPFATSVRFRVTIGAADLGSFSTCDGLSCEVEVVEHWEGGMDTHPWILPSRLRYSHIVLTRPLTASTVAAWQWVQAQVVLPIPATGRIVALDPDHKPIVRWDLDRVVPVRWQGPSFSAESSQAAMETLELAHHGFLPAG